MTNKFLRFINEATKSFTTADHLVYITYPLTNEVRLLLIAIENLHSCTNNCIDAFLYYERLYKRISEVPLQADDKLETFAKIIYRYGLKPQVIEIIKELKDIIKTHKQSHTEFGRKDKFIICTNNYKTRVVELENVKSYISIIRPLLKKLEVIKNDTAILR